MEHQIVAGHLRKKRKIVILTFFLLLLAFLENYYLSCMKARPGCELGWIYVILAAILLVAVYHYRK
jgi:hypothetical protein